MTVLQTIPDESERRQSGRPYRPIRLDPRILHCRCSRGRRWRGLKTLQKIAAPPNSSRRQREAAWQKEFGPLALDRQPDWSGRSRPSRSLSGRNRPQRTLITHPPIKSKDERYTRRGRARQERVPHCEEVCKRAKLRLERPMRCPYPGHANKRNSQRLPAWLGRPCVPCRPAYLELDRARNNASPPDTFFRRAIAGDRLRYMASIRCWRRTARTRSPRRGVASTVSVGRFSYRHLADVWSRRERRR